MRKGNTVIDQDVFSLADGTRLESVSDLVINEANDAIIALVIDEGGLMASSKVIPVDGVERFGPAAVMVADASVVMEADDLPAVKEIVDRKDRILDSRVVTHDGDDLGKISDIYFDETTGQIRGFEVSGGRIGDLMEGTSYLRLDQIEVVGPDAVITITEAKAFLDEQQGGVVGAVEEARERAGEVGDEIGGAVGEARDRDGTLVGRRSRRDVADRSGSIVVANGQEVQLEDVQRAREAGVIDELYRAVGAKRQRSAEEEARETADSLAESASDLWDRFTTSLSQLTDDAGRRIDREQTKRRLDRINDTIGRPVTKAILDRDDEVILDVGDLVTHKAVQRAHENGMLDSLLDSVYVAEIAFRREELRARVEADSTVDKAAGGAAVVEELEDRQETLERGDDPDERQNQNQASGSRQTVAAGRAETVE